VGARFERYVLDLLPALGLFPKASRHRIYRNGVEVGEVDILAVDGDGNTYAVEVKAGKIDITGRPAKMGYFFKNPAAKNLCFSVPYFALKAR
jgi:predicted RecB family endonuclease